MAVCCIVVIILARVAPFDCEGSVRVDAVRLLGDCLAEIELCRNKAVDEGAR